MAFARAARRARTVLVAVSMMAMAAGTTGCDTVQNWFGDDEPQDVELESISTVTFGGCLRAFGRDVFDVDASADGTVAVYISSQRPPNLPENASWRRDDRALYIRWTDENGAQRYNYLARSWQIDDAGGVIPAYSTPRPGQTGLAGFTPTEIMRGVEISDQQERLVVAVSREDSGETLTGLYHGSIPADVLNTKLSPGEEGEGSLTPVSVNSQRFSESIQQWALSPDGSRVAAEVGTDGELRVYNFDTNTLQLFVLGEDNEIEIAEGLPLAYATDGEGNPLGGEQAQAIGIDPNHRPAVLVNGAKMTWAPDGQRLALARNVGVGSAIIDVLNVVDGDLTRVKRFDATDVRDDSDGRTYRVTWSMPQLAWSAEGDSLFMMLTPVGGPELFYDTQFWEIDAETGKSVSGYYQEIRREENWKTEPANLVNFGQDEHFAFTWEDHLYRGDYRAAVPDGDPAQLASPAQLTSFPEGVQVLYETPIYTTAQDAVLFRISDRGTLRVGERTSASASECPADAAPAAEGDGAR